MPAGIQNNKPKIQLAVFGSPNPSQNALNKKNPAYHSIPTITWRTMMTNKKLKPVPITSLVFIRSDDMNRTQCIQSIIIPRCLSCRDALNRANLRYLANLEPLVSLAVQDSVVAAVGHIQRVLAVVAEALVQERERVLLAY